MNLSVLRPPSAVFFVWVRASLKSDVIMALQMDDPHDRSMSKDFTAEYCASSDTPGMQSAAGRKEGKPVTDIASLHRPIRLANYQAGHPSGQGLRLLPDLGSGPVKALARMANG